MDQQIGAAWQALAAELEHRLREDDPDARVQATVSVCGLLALDVRTIASKRSAARALAHSYEHRASVTCERCGEPVMVVGAGPVVTVLCSGCSDAG